MRSNTKRLARWMAVNKQTSPGGFIHHLGQFIQADMQQARLQIL
jgi:hypothetical protein